MERDVDECLGGSLRMARTELSQNCVWDKVCEEKAKRAVPRCPVLTICGVRCPP